MRIAPQVPRLTLAVALVVGASAAAIVTGGACSSGGGTTDVPDAAGPDDSAFYDCTMETRALAYAPDLDRMSKKGGYDAKLVATTPGPWVKGSNSWTVQILNGAGAPADGLTVKATPFMPDHNHGTSVKAVVTPGTDGSYAITPLYLYMSGYWEVTLDIAPAGDVPADSVVFPVCISG